VDIECSEGRNNGWTTRRLREDMMGAAKPKAVVSRRRHGMDLRQKGHEGMPLTTDGANRILSWQFLHELLRV